MSQRNEDLFRQRLAKAEQLRAMGIDPYPARARCTHRAAEALALLDRIESGKAEASIEPAVCGRIRLARFHGQES